MTIFLHNSLCHHRTCHLHEPGDIGALHVIDVVALLAMCHALVVDIAHNLVQTRVDLGCRPGDMHGVLRHFQTGGRYTTCIHRLARRKELMMGDEEVDRLGRTTHIRHLGHAERMVVDELLGVVGIQFVLRRTWKRDVHLLFPRFAAGIERGVRELFDVRFDHVVTRRAELQHVVDFLARDAFRVVDIDRQGNIESRLRYTYIHQSVAFASIANDVCVQDGTGDFLLSINTYHTAAPAKSVTCSFTDNNGASLAPVKSLAPQSDWNWRAHFRLPETCRGRRIFVTATVRFSDGSIAKERTSFVYDSPHNVLHADWVTNLKANLLYTQPVVAEGKVFIASLDEELRGEAAVFALDAETGKQLWRHEVRNSIKNNIAYAEGTVLAQDAEGYLYALDASASGSSAPYRYRGVSGFGDTGAA